MAELPQQFVESMRLLMGNGRLESYLRAFAEPAPASIRLNPLKAGGMSVDDGEAVPWCRGGYYLSRRPNFTMDPLLHAGCYYVQEAASMFLDEVLRQQLPTLIAKPHSQSENSHCEATLAKRELSTLNSLDLCAAPGGKSTLLRAVLPEDSMLYSNEPIRQRASILAENVEKWGWPNHIVTSQYPKAFHAAKMTFDVILADVPCSGEGMFRKDPATISEWSPQQVEKCCALQRDIISDIWPCLREGGLFIYSTCTFNTKENEENIRWILREYDAEVLPIATRPEWNITGSLLDDFHEPVYRFIPGITRSEGLFLCALRKKGRSLKLQTTKPKASGLGALGNSNGSPADEVAHVELTYQQAIAYLRGEALVLLADTPRGIVAVGFMGHRLGQVKNIGSRANNLYPKPWRIKTTHTATAYEPILQQL